MSGTLSLVVAAATSKRMLDSSVYTDAWVQASRNYAKGSNPTSAILAGLNARGRINLVSGGAKRNQLSLLLGNVDGSFQAARTYATGTLPRSAIAEDVNGDGRIDLVSAVYLSDHLSVFFGNGDGPFHAAQSFAPCIFP